MKFALGIIFAIGMLLLAASATPVQQQKHLPLGRHYKLHGNNVPAYDLVFDSLFNVTNLPNAPAAGNTDTPCLADFMARNVEILAAFGNATLACLNLQSNNVAQFFVNTDMSHYKRKFNLRMQRCGHTANIERSKKCYAQTVSNTLDEVSAATMGSSLGNVMCVISSADVMVDSIGVSSDLLISCIDSQMISGVNVPGLLGGLLGGNANSNSLNWPFIHIPFWPWKTTKAPSYTTASPQFNVSTPAWNVSTPSWNVSSPATNVSTPGWIYSTPSWNASTPGWNYSTPNLNTSTPGWGPSTPGWNYSTPNWNASTPGWNYSTPAWNYTTQSWNYSTPVWNYTTESWNFSSPVWNYTTESWNFSSPVWNYTTESWNFSSPVWNFTTESWNFSTPIWNYTTESWNFSTPIWNYTTESWNFSTPIWNYTTASWNNTTPGLAYSTPVSTTTSQPTTTNVPWYKKIWHSIKSIF